MEFSRPTTGSVSRWITLCSVLGASIAVLVASGEPRPAGATNAPDRAMTNEDVVKMVADHLPTDEILKAIRAARATAFDLDPDIVIELRRAGVPEAIIAAMSEAQRARRPPPAEAPEDKGIVELVFEKDEKGSVPKSTAVALAKDWNDRPVSLAFFVYCFEALHVPDLWETKTSLPPPFPRHHLIWFHEATRPWRDNRRGGLIYLDLPDEARVEAKPGTHPLELGVVARAGDRAWDQLASAEATVEVKAGMTSRIVVRVRSRRADRLDIAWGGEPWVTCAVISAGPPRPPSP